MSENSSDVSLNHTIENTALPERNLSSDSSDSMNKPHCSNSIPLDEIQLDVDKDKILSDQDPNYPCDRSFGWDDSEDDAESTSSVHDVRNLNCVRKIPIFIKCLVPTCEEI